MSFHQCLLCYLSVCWYISLSYYLIFCLSVCVCLSVYLSVCFTSFWSSCKDYLLICGGCGTIFISQISGKLTDTGTEDKAVYTTALALHWPFLYTMLTTGSKSFFSNLYPSWAQITHTGATPQDFFKKRITVYWIKYETHFFLTSIHILDTEIWSDLWTLKKSGFQIKGISTHSSVLPPVSTLLSVCLLVYLFVLLSDFLSVCVRLSVCLPVCLFYLFLKQLQRLFAHMWWLWDNFYQSDFR